MTVFRTMNVSMGFVILSAFSISFSYPENDVMHPVPYAYFFQQQERLTRE